MSIEYKVPRVLWENLESVLLAQSKRYIAELAKRLCVPEKELLKRVLPSSDSLKVTIQDTHAECNQCKAYIQQDTVTTFCRKPTAYGSEFCSFHRNRRMAVVNGIQPIELQRLKDIPTQEPLWLNQSTLYNSKGDIVGKISKEQGKIKLFTISA
jgi:hypothetical protein